MVKRMAVITGTFNPVTKAHLEMGKIAQNILGNDTIVIYVPAPSSFLQSWKQMETTEILSDSFRIALLKCVVKEHNFLCDTCETDKIVNGKTYYTLGYLTDKYHIKKENVYLVCGSDKVKELYLWHRAKALLSEYRFLIIRRKFDNVGALICEDRFLTPYQNRFIVIPGTAELQTCNATKIRKAIQAGDTATVQNLMPESAYRLLEGRERHE